MLYYFPIDITFSGVKVTFKKTKIKFLATRISTIIVLFVISFTGSAGDLDSPSAPSNITSGMYTLDDLYNRLNTGAPGNINTFTESTQTPASQGYNINQIMAIAPQVDNQFGATPADVEYGKKFWGLTDGAWGLQTGTKITLFSCVPPAYVFNSPSDPNNIDGTGKRWCIPGDGTVIDLLTGLVWLRDLGALGNLPWDGCQVSSCTVAGTTGKTAVGILAELEDGFPIEINGTATTLSDGSVSGDWRAPTISEAIFLNSVDITENLSGIVPQPFYRFSLALDSWTSSHTPNSINASIPGVTGHYYASLLTVSSIITTSSSYETLKNVIAVRSRKLTP